MGDLCNSGLSAAAQDMVVKRTRCISSATSSLCGFIRRLQMLETSASAASPSSSLEMRRTTSMTRQMLCASHVPLLYGEPLLAY